jgi:hypothetical protein
MTDAALRRLTLFSYVRVDLLDKGSQGVRVIELSRIFGKLVQTFTEPFVRHDLCLCVDPASGQCPAGAGQRGDESHEDRLSVRGHLISWPDGAAV